MSEPFDILIRNGLVLDGTGAPGRRADVGMRGDCIAAIGDLAAATATQIVDATGRVVCPGFIDAHSHSDAFLLIEPDAPSKVSQGVTTEVVGQCGASAAPLFGQGRMPTSHLPPHARLARPGPRWRNIARFSSRCVRP